MQKHNAEERSHPIAESLHGEVSYCSCCKQYQLKFKNIGIPFSKKGLESFKSVLEQSYLNLALEQNHNPTLKIRCANMMLSFKLEEADEILELIKQAQIETVRAELEYLYQLPES
ncbi:hypothetical protein COW36_24110 [bacterium (Candidatus Blackallbacteria) CG17_big_fil_post_rev_8_21_14_2_50_48_46]|uniref:Uncharacterized protein n=1 Tax=bacterium (Candidatus Blackallbacteria) CG17_big_fil_post_rev_8_21_14_2_50_48_46 TaxID=2014261 RepID=A0A2M7FX91_9BACT|nr:MAG: hypothetical protein COW64_19050 [bacterium (Candidatus Blackallbacteria) CG18_big_fil_WC_8_21_14_2_50_49_26]PIW13755.1 MAG: hypothetical protein COW36_24110 [bacterium (Candidatus Blackallbacteria) CG17_big_fil_post_rev_8_21_14_2_50_48_46]PIW44981.1 MAG: hypothetical protein COW20_21740 [bacterium (Candidatus Blackallbacteria) CG13_big_fil_rev_8_21_14_2_50_49_14]